MRKVGRAVRRAELVTAHRKKIDFAHTVHYLVDGLYPDADRRAVVLDDLNTHHDHSLVEHFGKDEADRIMERVCFYFTPHMNHG